MTTKPDLRCPSPTLALLQTLALLLNLPDLFLRSRLFFNLPQHSSHITSVQYCGGCSVHWRLFSTSGDNISTVGNCFSTVEVARYSGGSFSTVEVVQYSEDNISTVEGVQYCGLIPLDRYLRYCGGNSSTCGGYLQYCGGYLQSCGGCSVQWGIESVQWGIASV